jgi:hypothetical protein
MAHVGVGVGVGGAGGDGGKHPPYGESP